MNAPSFPSDQGSSTRPYLIRALHDWCVDNGFTPYLAVYVDGSVRVPMEYVKNREIVLNVSFDATSGLTLGNDFIEFKARFGGVARDILVPVSHVVAIYARENGQGMAFPVPIPPASQGPVTGDATRAAPDTHKTRRPRTVTHSEAVPPAAVVPLQAVPPVRSAPRRASAGDGLAAVTLKAPRKPRAVTDTAATQASKASKATKAPKMSGAVTPVPAPDSAPQVPVAPLNPSPPARGRPALKRVK